MIRVLRDNVLVKIIEKENVTPHGIILTDANKDKEIFLEAKVITTGKGKLSDSGILIPLTVKAGDRVMIAKYAGVEIEHEDEKFMLIAEKDIIGIID